MELTDEEEKMNPPDKPSSQKKTLHGQRLHMGYEERDETVDFLCFLFSKSINNEPETSAIHMRIVNPKS